MRGRPEQRAKPLSTKRRDQRGPTGDDAVPPGSTLDEEEPDAERFVPSRAEQDARVAPAPRPRRTVRRPVTWAVRLSGSNGEADPAVEPAPATPARSAKRPPSEPTSRYADGSRAPAYARAAAQLAAEQAAEEARERVLDEESTQGGAEELRRHRAIDYDLDAEGEHWALRAFQAATPGLTFLTQRFDQTWLRRDAIAGVTVAAYLVPQVMAYSAIVGVPPVTGLWTALAAMVVYAVMGNSRVLSVGPEATISLLVGLAVAPLAHGDPARTVELAAALSLVVAGWAFVARLFRLGVVADLLSQPLLVGYLAGAAVLMVVGQLGNLTGTPVSGDSIVAQVRSFSTVVGHTHLTTLAVGGGTLSVILAIHWLRPRWPASLIGVTVATIAYAVLRSRLDGVRVVGDVPSGIPVPHVPQVTWPELKVLLVAGLGVTLMSYSDNMLFARAFPAPPLPGERPSQREVDPQSELVALGGTHVVVGLIGGFPVSSSGSRTALAIAGRARSQMYSLVAALVVVLMLFVAGPVMRYMPQASLGAVVVYAASKLLSLRQFRRLARFRRRELLLSIVTLIGTVVYGILAGVGLAVALSLLEMGQRLARPHDAVLGRVPGLAGMHDVADYPNAETLPGLVIYRFDAPLFFANVGDLRRRVQLVVDKELDAYPDQPPRWLLLNVEANTEVDLTSADGLRELQGDLEAQDIRLGLVRIKRDLYEPLRRAGVIDAIGEDMLFPTLPVAEEAFVLWATAHPLGEGDAADAGEAAGAGDADADEAAAAGAGEAAGDGSATGIPDGGTGEGGAGRME